jgi:hypothetical protein
VLFATSTAITFYAFFTASKVGKSGITVKVSVNGPTGSNIITVASATAATEVDATNQPGLFSYTLTSGNTATEGGYSAHFYTTDGTVDAQHLEALEFCWNWIGYIAGAGSNLKAASSYPTNFNSLAISAAGQVTPDTVLLTGTASAGATNSITLAGGSATDNLYKYNLVNIIGGTGAGQARLIINYVGSTKVATVNKDWQTNPDATSVFRLIGIATPTVVHSGIAQAGAGSTITLQSIASATDSLYVGSLITIFSGTGAFQSRIITGYVGATKVATVDMTWAVNPDSTSVYEISAVGRAWADLFAWNGTLVAAPNVAGVPKVDVTNVLGTASAGVAGYMAPDWSHINAPTTAVDLSGTTVKNVDNAIATVTTVTNVTNAPTAGDFTAAMKTSLNAATPASVTGAVGSVTGNVGGNVVGSVGSVVATVAANLTQILGTALTETAGQLAAGFKKFFNVAVPVHTVASVDQTGDSFARIGAAGAGLTALGDARIANLDAAVSTRMATFTLPTNFSSLAINATGQVTPRSELLTGTATAGAASTITLAAGSATDNLYTGSILTILSGTGAGQSRIIAGYVGSTKVVTVDLAWITNPDNTSVYVISSYGRAWSDVYAWNGTAVSAPNVAGIPKVDVTNILGTASAGVAGYVAPDWSHVNAPTTALDLSGTTIKNVDNPIAAVTAVTTVTNLTNAPTAGDFTAAMKTSLNAATPASVVGAVGSVTGAVGSVAGNVGGNVVGSVGSVVAQVTPDTVLLTGTASAGAASTITLAGGSATDNLYRHALVGIIGGTGAGQVRLITGYVGSTKVATVDMAWTTNPDATSVFRVIPWSDDVRYILGTVSAGAPGYVGHDWAAINAPTTTVDLSGTTIKNVDNAIAAVTTVTGGVTVATNNDKTGYALTGAEHTAIAGDVLSATAASYNAAGTIGQKINAAGGASDPLLNAVPGSYGAGTAGLALGSIAGIKAKTDTIAFPTNFSTQVIDANGRIDLSKVNGSAINNLISGRVDSSVGAVASAVIAAGSFAANALGAVWDELTSGHVVASTFGKLLGTFTFTGSNVNANTQVNSDKTGYALTAGEHTAIATDAQTGLTAQGYTTARAGFLDTLNGLVAAVWAAATRTLTAFGFNVTVGTNNDKTGYTVSTNQDKTGYALTAGEHTAIAGDVLNATASSYNTALTIGSKINASGASGDPLLNTVPGSYGAGTAGAALGNIAGSVLNAAAASYNTGGSIGAKINAAGGAADPLLNPVPGSYVAGTAGAALAAIPGIKTKTDTIGSANVTYVSPVTANGTATGPIVIGNDYKAADGRSLDWTISGFPSFTGGTAKFSVRQYGVLLLSISATILSATQLRVELTRAQTAAFPAGVLACDITVTLSDGDTVTPVLASMNVIASVTP